ncbi:unnamed protein product [Ectocarpus sp. 13 AM-2016]
MGRPPQLLQVVAMICLSCLPSVAFTPGAIDMVFLRHRQQRDDCCSRSTARGDHEQQGGSISTSLANKRSCRQDQHSRNTELRAAGGGTSDRGKFLQRVAAGTFAAGVATTAAVTGPDEAGAFCGEPYPYWAYFMDFDEVFIPFKFEGYSGKLFARTVGNGKDQKKAQHNPVVIIPGGPGLPHDYLETLEGAAMEDRVVLLFDPVGTGNSSAIPSVDAAADSPNLLGTASLVAQTRAVVDYFKVNVFHVLGHGTGAEAALELGRSSGKASPRPPGPEPEAILSVILASPVLGENELSPDFLEALRTPYIKDGNEPPLCLETAMASRSSDGFARGLAAMKQDRRSKGSAAAAAAGPLACPVLITYGKRDVIGDKTVAGIKQGLSGGDAPVECRRFEESGHLAHLDEREEYVSLVKNYVTFIDDAWSGNSGDTKK